MKKSNLKILNLKVLVGLCVFVSSCASLPGGRVEKLAGRKVDFVLHRGQGPTVIFENGLGGQYHWWAKVFPQVAKTGVTVFAYNRPGYGDSESVSTARNGQTAVEELRQVLRDPAMGLTPPYILVGHSLGGLYFQDFARRYPDEVQALILVDSTHPEQMSGDGAVDRWPWWVRTAVQWLTPAAGLKELSQVEDTGATVLSLPSLEIQKIPVIILLATEPENPSSPLEVHAVQMRKDFHRLYPHATFVTVSGDHSIPLHSPQVVVDQILSVISKNSPLPKSRD